MVQDLSKLKNQGAQAVPCPAEHQGFLVPTVMLPTVIKTEKGDITVHVTSEMMCMLCHTVIRLSKPVPVGKEEKKDNEQ
jgi:hypothetical protein